MIFRNLWIESFRHFAAPVHFGPFQDGINVIYGANATGKSTMQRAITHILFDRPDSKSRDFAALVPWHRDVVPLIRLEFEHQGETYQIEKRFAADGTARLLRRDGDQLILWKEGQTATDWVRQCWGASASQRGLTRLENWGVGQLCIVEQGDLAIRSPLNTSTHDWLREAAIHLLAGRHAESVEHQIEQQYLQFFTPTGQIKKNSPSRELAQKHKVLAAQHDEMARTLESLLKTKTELEQNRRDQQTQSQTRAVLADSLHSLAQKTNSLQLLQHRQSQLQSQLAIAYGQVAEIETLVLKRNQTKQQMQNTEQRLVQDRADLLQIGTQLSRLQCDADANALGQEQLSEQLAQLDTVLLGIQAARLSKQKYEQLSLAITRVREIDHRLKALEVEQEPTLPTAQQLDELTLALAQRDGAAQQAQPVQLEVSYFSNATSSPESPQKIRGIDELSFVANDTQFLVRGQILRSAQAHEQATLVYDNFLRTWKNCDPSYWHEQRKARIGAQLEFQFLRQERFRLIGSDSPAELDRRLASLASLLVGIDLSDEALALHTADRVRILQQLAALKEVVARIEQNTKNCRNRYQNQQEKIHQAERELASLVGAQAQWPADLELRLEECRALAQRYQLELTTIEQQTVQLGADSLQHETLQQKLAESEVAATELDRQEQRLMQRIVDLEQHFSEDTFATVRKNLLSLTQQKLAAEQNEQALLLLVELFREERIKLQEQVVRPVAQAMQQTLQEIWPPADSLAAIDQLTLDENFMPQHVPLASQPQPVAVADLSYGARDQLALVSRLTLAYLIAGEQKYPALLDDPLVHVDALQREKTMQFFRRMAARLQIFVFTCHPEDYVALDSQAAFFGLSNHDISQLAASETSL